MIAYLKSENYRFLRKKNILLISTSCLSLIAAAACILKYFDMTESTFPYGNAPFFYSNVIALSALILFVAVLVNSILTGDDRLVLKQPVSFGIARQKIFWSKLIVTLGYFILLCIVGIFLSILLGTILFSNEANVIHAYLVAIINMAPLILSGFILTHTLFMLNISEVFILGILLFVYVISDDIMLGIGNYLQSIHALAKYMPSMLLTDNMYKFMELRQNLIYTPWVVGMTISLITLTIGVKQFNKKSID